MMKIGKKILKIANTELDNLIRHQEKKENQEPKSGVMFNGFDNNFMQKLKGHVDFMSFINKDFRNTDQQSRGSCS